MARSAVLCRWLAIAGLVALLCHGVGLALGQSLEAQTLAKLKVMLAAGQKLPTMRDFVNKESDAPPLADDSRLRLLATAVLQYSQDFDGKLPPLDGEAVFREATKPYVRNDRDFIERATGKAFGRNASLAARAVSSIANPSKTVMLFARAAQPGGARLLAFVDGHVAGAPEGEAARMAMASGVDPKQWATVPALPGSTIPDAYHASRDEILAFFSEEQKRAFAKDVAELLAMKQDGEISSERFFPFAVNPIRSAQAGATRRAVLFEPGPNGSGRRLVGFDDGSIQTVTESAWKAQRAGWGVTAQIDASECAEIKQLEDIEGLIFTLDDPLKLRPVLYQSRMEALGILSISNLKQIANAILLYESDHGDSLPKLTSPEDLRAAVSGIVQNDAVFADPLFKLPYRTVPELSGKSESTIQNPSETIVAYEDVPIRTNRAVAYADSHVARVSDDVFRSQLQAAGCHIPTDSEDERHKSARRLEELQEAYNRATLADDLQAARIAAQEMGSIASAGNAPPLLVRTADLDLGAIYEHDGRFDDAEALYRAMPKDDGASTSGFDELTMVQIERGEFAAAIPELERQAKGLAQLKTKDPEMYAVEASKVLLTLGEAYVYCGRNAEAEQMLALAQTVALQNLDMGYETALAGQASLYLTLGQRERAYALLTGTAELRELWTRMEALSEIQGLIESAGHTSYDRFVRDLDQQYSKIELGQQELKAVASGATTDISADETDRLIRSVAQATSGRIHSMLLTAALPEVARKYLDSGDAASAEATIVKLEATNGEPGMGKNLAALQTQALRALLDAEHGDKAAIARLRGLADLPDLKASGPLTPLRRNLDWLLQDTSLACEGLGDQAGARQTAVRALEGEEQELRTALACSSEAEVVDFVGSTQRTLDVLLSEATAPNAPTQTVLAAAEWAALRKGRVFDAILEARRARDAANGDPRAAKVWDELQSIRSDLASRRERTPVETTALEARANGLERDLAALTPPSVRADAPPADSLSNALDADEALVDYEIYTATRLGKGPGPRRLIAFVYRRGASPKLFDLGDAAPVESLIRTARGYHEARSARGHVGGQAATTTYQDYTDAAGHLRTALVDPLLPALGDVRTLRICPNGELNRLPFEALPFGDGRMLVEAYAVAYLSSPKDLLRPVAAPAAGVTVIAGPDYDAAGASTERGASEKPSEELTFPPLSGAASEGAKIEHLLEGSSFAPITLQTGPAATEAFAKSAPPARILHFATHGYVLPDRPPVLVSLPVGPGGVQVRQIQPFDDPLLRSGLALAGANHAAEAQGADDGWLTSSEIAGMKLTGTDLVVLSACDTGLGELKASEGVFGLRRAFQSAGAANVVMSLFEVPDQETSQFMSDFYEALRSGASYLVALHRAQLSGLSRERSSHGVAWSDFVFVGAAK